LRGFGRITHNAQQRTTAVASSGGRFRLRPGRGRRRLLPIFPATVEVLRPGRGAHLVEVRKISGRRRSPGRESREDQRPSLVEVLTWSRVAADLPATVEVLRPGRGRRRLLPIFPATVEVLRPGRGAEDQRPSLVEVLATIHLSSGRYSGAFPSQFRRSQEVFRKFYFLTAHRLR